MIKKKVLSQDSEEFETCKERVIIRWDQSYCFDRGDCDRIFKFWATNTRECSSDTGAENPLVERETEDHVYLVEREGFVVFRVSAYIHSGRVWALGRGEGFPDFQWDVSSMGFLYTNKELFENLMGEGTWKNSVNGKPFMDWLREQAQLEIKEMNLAESGNVYWYETEKRVDFKRVYQDGHEVEDHEWEDGEDSCGGFLTDKIDEIDFPRDPNVPVFAVGDGATHLVGDEYTIPEFIVRRESKTSQGWEYLYPDGYFGKILQKAKVFYSHHAAQAAYRVTIDPNPTDPSVVYHHIIEKDDVCKEPSNG